MMSKYANILLAYLHRIAGVFTWTVQSQLAYLFTCLHHTCHQHVCTAHVNGMLIVIVHAITHSHTHTPSHYTEYFPERRNSQQKERLIIHLFPWLVSTAVFCLPLKLFFFRRAMYSNRGVSLISVRRLLVFAARLVGLTLP